LQPRNARTGSRAVTRNAGANAITISLSAPPATGSGTGSDEMLTPKLQELLSRAKEEIQGVSRYDTKQECLTVSVDFVLGVLYDLENKLVAEGGING